jgi:transcriptional regulator with XRE-family HTH domain
MIMALTSGPEADGIGESTLLSERLKNTREYLNLTQQQVSEQTGIPRTAISEIEGGRRKVDSLELKKLARLYRYPVAYFLNEDLDAIPAEHALAALPRKVAGLNLKTEQMNQVMKFAQFLQMSYQADAEAARDDDPQVLEHRGEPS